MTEWTRGMGPAICCQERRIDADNENKDMKDEATYQT